MLKSLRIQQLLEYLYALLADFLKIRISTGLSSVIVQRPCVVVSNADGGPTLLDSARTTDDFLPQTLDLIACRYRDHSIRSARYCSSRAVRSECRTWRMLGEKLRLLVSREGCVRVFGTSSPLVCLCPSSTVANVDKECIITNARR